MDTMTILIPHQFKCIDNVPDCTDCKAMANLTSTHLAEIKVEEGRIK
jgi:hypothetical protein